MTREDTQRAVTAMEAHGGSFIKALAAAWRAADPVNKAVIEMAWEQDFARYAAWEDN